MMIKNIAATFVIAGISMAACKSGDKKTTGTSGKDSTKTVKGIIDTRPIDTAEYNKKMMAVANGDTTGRWPVKGPYPLAGALLPYNRIVAYYGNLYSKKMGALGEFPKAEMLKKLQAECEHWRKADSTTPVIPALHYIAMTAQGAPGADGKYRYRMPFHQIDTIVNWAKEINALTFLDIQVGHSTVQEEVPLFKEYLKSPTMHFGIDPEFSMKGGEKPGSKIGTYTAADINFVINYLATIVKENNLPPKILVVHRFTRDMVQNYKDIKLVPEVQVVMDMDGWGDKDLKKGTYRYFIVAEPVQFTGFKLFYKNDLKKGSKQLLTPEELMQLSPKPLYIQYQ